MEESDPTYPLCNDKPKTLEYVPAPVRQLLEMGYTWRHNRVLEELVKFIKNYMKSEPTISTQKFVLKMGRIYAGSKQTIELYPVKTFLDQIEITRYLPTYQDGITITQKQYLAKVFNQTLFFCQR